MNAFNKLLLWHHDDNPKDETWFTYTTSLGVAFYISDWFENGRKFYQMFKVNGDNKPPVGGSSFVCYGDSVEHLKNIAQQIFDSQIGFEAYLDAIEKEARDEEA